jgi:hypothetical protein
VCSSCTDSRGGPATHAYDWAETGRVLSRTSTALKWSLGDGQTGHRYIQCVLGASTIRASAMAATLSSPSAETRSRRELLLSALRPLPKACQGVLEDPTMLRSLRRQAKTVMTFRGTAGAVAHSDLSSLVREAGEPVHQSPPKAWMSCTDAVIRRVKTSMAVLSAGNAAACATTTSRYVVTPPL